jgi:hypothetical protein
MRLTSTFLVLFATLAAAQGAPPKVWSCQSPTDLRECEETTDASMTEFRKKACLAVGSAFAAEPCSTDWRLGSCKTRPGVTMQYSALPSLRAGQALDVSHARARCVELSGEFVPAPPSEFTDAVIALFQRAGFSCDALEAQGTCIEFSPLVPPAMLETQRKVCSATGTWRAGGCAATPALLGRCDRPVSSTPVYFYGGGKKKLDAASARAACSTLETAGAGNEKRSGQFVPGAAPRG